LFRLYLDEIHKYQKEYIMASYGEIIWQPEIFLGSYGKQK